MRQAGDSVNSWVFKRQSFAMGAERLHFCGASRVMEVASAFLNSNIRNYLKVVTCCYSRINIYVCSVGHVYTATPQPEFNVSDILLISF